MPAFRKYDFHVSAAEPATFTLRFRIPEWIMAEASVYVNNVLHGTTRDSENFYDIAREWKEGDTVSITLPIGIRFIPLPDDERTGAFRYGPEVLAGLCETERQLYVEEEDIASAIENENEREWGSWRYFFRTVSQDPVITFKRIRDIGYEPYQIYFKVKKLNSTPS